jgi:hypothetical protein
MKFYVLRLADWLPNAVRQTNQPKYTKPLSLRITYILFFLQTFITNYLRHVKKPGRNFK